MNSSFHSLRHDYLCGVEVSDILTTNENLGYGACDLSWPPQKINTLSLSQPVLQSWSLLLYYGNVN